MKLLLVRHGETDWNLAQRFQGHSDIPLNEKGFWQAEQLAKRLCGERIDALYSSDLARALQTARQIASLQEQSLPVQADARWREISLGTWEGLKYEEIHAHWSDAVTRWYADPGGSPPPNGETILQFAERLQSAVDELKIRHRDETVLLVSHGGAIQVLLCLLLGVELKRYWQFHIRQASLSMIRFYEDSAILDLYSDVGHLKVP
jgi:alpha-ribazole phosphatase